MIVGYDFFGYNMFESDIPATKSLNYAQITGAIYDELEIRESVLPLDSTILNKSNGWQFDTALDAKFEGDLEAGNIDNQGIEIASFIIKRRVSGDTNDIQIGTLPFVNNSLVKFTDKTQPVGTFVYSIVPLGVNNIQGKPNQVTVTSDFYGWWIVDKATMNAYQFDLTLSNDQHSMMTNGSVPIKLNQGRIQIDTMSQYPQVYYSDQQYHTFDLTALMIPSVDYTFTDWTNFVSLITQKKPLIAKSGSGDLYVVDVFAPNKTSLLNAYKNHDYMTVTVSAMEIQDYADYMSS